MTIVHRTSSLPELLLALRRPSEVPLRLQLERELRTAIQEGRLRPRTRLPSSRGLALDLGVSRGVVVEAYDQLLAEGYLSARPGSATRVASHPRAPAAPPIARGRSETQAPRLRYDLRPGLPDLGLFPRLSWLASLRTVVTTAPEAALGYPDPRGPGLARAAVSAYLNRVRATASTPDTMLLCTGFAQGLRLVCRGLRERGVRAVAVEDPWHPLQRATLAAEGLRVTPIPVDDEGLRVDRLAASAARAVFVTPAHQFPTGAVLSPARRAALLQWAARRDGVVVEDDYDAEYRYDREPIGALQGLAPERVAYCGSASKTLSPALRIGWLALPSSLAGAVIGAKREEDLGSPPLELLAYADFLQRGELDRHLRKTRLLYRARRDALLSALARQFPGARVRGIAAGLHVLVELPAGVNEAAVIEAAARRSLGVYGLRRHRARLSRARPALLLGYGNLRPEDARRAVRLLVEAAASQASAR